MFDLKSFKIDLKELEQGANKLGFDLDDTYFEAINGPEVRRGNVRVDVEILRSGDCFELKFRCNGTVHVPCDICLEDMEQPIDTENSIVAKFGDEYSEDDDLITVAENEGMLDVAWLVYEFIALDIPIRHVHAPGKCNPVMIEKLKEHSADRSGGEQGGSIDPRWSGLEKLKNNI